MAMLGDDVRAQRQREGGLAVTLSAIPGTTKKELLKAPLDFHVAPLDQFGWEVSYGWQDYDTITAGQFTSYGTRQLRTLTINSMVMDFNTSWTAIVDAEADTPYSGSAPNPREVAKGLDELASAGSPILLTVTGELDYEPELEMPVTLRRVSIQERAGEPDARYFDMDFVEYRIPTIARKGYGNKHDLPARVKINEHGVAIEFARDGKKVTEKQIHRIGTQSNPATLRSLAKHFYGTPKLWKRIALKNDMKVKSWGPDESLKKLYDKRKRKNQPVTLVIPEAPKNNRSGGVSVNG